MNLKQMVIDEAVKLKEHATPDELARLDFYGLRHNNPFTCIYGQMTGNCDSSRARELLGKCAVPYSRSNNIFRPTKRKTFIVLIHERNRTVYSAIEFYISKTTAKNKTLIEFLKGERRTLKESDL